VTAYPIPEGAARASAGQHFAAHMAKLQPKYGIARKICPPLWWRCGAGTAVQPRRAGSKR